MKYSIALLSVVGAAVAQDLGSLPACGQTCIANMVGIASSQFGCAAGDISCYCSNIDFGYGVRDCSNEACGSAEEANQVISYGTNYCAQAIASSPAESALSSAAGVTDGPTGTEGVASTPVTTSALETTIVSDGQTQVQTTGFTTLYAPVGADASSALSSVASEASNIIGSLSSDLASATSALSDAIESATTATDGSQSETSSSATESTSSPAAAPMITAAPILGGAAIAAMLFI